MDWPVPLNATGAAIGVERAAADGPVAADVERAGRRAMKLPVPVREKSWVVRVAALPVKEPLLTARSLTVSAFPLVSSDAPAIARLAPLLMALLRLKLPPRSVMVPLPALRLLTLPAAETARNWLPLEPEVLV